MIPTHLETDRLILRKLCEADSEAYCQMCADEEVMRYLGSPALAADDAWRQLAMFVGHWALRGFGMYAVLTRPGEFVGRVGLHFPLGWPEREIGWALDRRHWGQGYAFEAAAAVRDLALQDLKWPRLVSYIFPENARSIRLARRLGGQEEGEIALRGFPALRYGYGSRPGDPG